MLRGFYEIASGMLTQQKTLNVLTNNIANVETPGFRASRVVSTTFEHEYLTRIEGYNTGRIGTGTPIRMVSEVPTRFDPSSLLETGYPYDMALEGLGYFNIQVTEEGAEGEEGTATQYLTRNGSFDLNDQNQLILPEQGLVLGQNGPITLETADFTVDPDGSIYNGRGELVDKLLITIPPEGTEIEQVRNGMFSVEDMAANLPVEGTNVIQGWVENSNIDLNQEYAMVMQAQRAFQACSTALQIIDQIDRKAATQIASL